MTALRILDLGRRAYGPVLELQRAMVQARLAGQLADDVLVLVEHDPVVTLGRSTRPTSLPVPREALEQRGFTVYQVERGGDVTLHAPGQLVGYPILDLAAHRPDVHWYLRQLEEVLIRALAALGLRAHRDPGRTGVWMGPRKIASIGVHLKRWVTLHGFALNVTTDLSLFDAIVPCGLAGVQMTSVARELDGPVRATLWTEATQAVVVAFREVFGYLGVTDYIASHGDPARHPAPGGASRSAGAADSVGRGGMGARGAAPADTADSRGVCAPGGDGGRSAALLHAAAGTPGDRAACPVDPGGREAAGAGRGRRN